MNFQSLSWLLLFALFWSSSFSAILVKAASSNLVTLTKLHGNRICRPAPQTDGQTDRHARCLITSIVEWTYRQITLDWKTSTKRHLASSITQSRFDKSHAVWRKTKHHRASFFFFTAQPTALCYTKRNRQWIQMKALLSFSHIINNHANSVGYIRNPLVSKL